MLARLQTRVSKLTKQSESNRNVYTFLPPFEIFIGKYIMEYMFINVGVERRFETKQFLKKF